MSSSIDLDAIEVLKNKIRAEEDANRLKQKELLLLERRETMFLSYLDETAKLRHEIKILLEYYQKHALQDDALQDMLLGLSDRLERLERIAVLQLAMRSNTDEAREVREELRAELERKHIQKLLEKNYRSLKKLEEREAEYGLRAPVELCNQIEAVKEKIAELEGKLE